jgi:Na+-transporting methylmalonyl-CoA/oxaloacetate decarboxylase gamma subunit
MNFVDIEIALITFGIVMAVMIALFILFKMLGRAYNINIRKRWLIKKGKYEEAENLQEITSGEVNAAIAVALYYYRTELEELESSRLTIQRVAKTYSPWSSKIYGLRKAPK